MDFIVQNYNIDRKALQESIDENGLLYTSNILSESLDKSVDNAYIAGTLYAMHLREKATNMYEFYRDKPYLFDPEVRQYILDHYTELETYIDHTRDYGKQYSAIKTFAKNYLFKYKGKGIESIQWAWMRVAVQVAMPNLDEVLSTYDMMSKNEAIHATPTCINAGYCIPQLESCFCGRIGDSMLEIADIQKLLLMGSKCNGGFGIFMGDIRHSRVANRGITKGVTGLCRVINSLVPYADQLGSRPMAVNVQLPIWHCDIPTFITMKDENTAIDIKATKLNYTVCIPDLFMKRCYTGGSWSLFCPRECKLLWVEKHGGDVDNTHEVDRAPSLCDVNGDEFEEYYTMCEQGGIAKETWNANDLYLFLNRYRCMVGEPYIFFHDNVNRKSNHQHLGTTVQTNLCVHGDTLILTDEGYHPIRELTDKMVNVWNGEEWSKVTPMKTGENQQLITVSFSNGSEIKCTPYHKFYILLDDNTVEMRAIDLLPGMTIIPYTYENIEYKNIAVSHISTHYEYADTYCFNESKRHMGIFNGIIAGNCTEITQYTGNKGSPHGEMVATCDLATINVSSLVQEDSSFNWHRLGVITRQLVRNLDRVLDRTSGVIIEKPNKEMEMYLQDDNPMIRRIAQDMLHNMDPTNRARERMRSIGIGIMGLASCFALMNIQYGSKESFSLGTKIRACIEWHSKDESSNLAQLYGSYPTFEGSPLSKGILQHDMWRHEDNYMSQYLNDLHNKEYDGYTKRYTYKEVDPVSFGVEDTWYNLRQKIMQYGVRNSLTTCQMPNATTSGIFGVSASIEPFYEVYYIVDNTNGKDTTIYDCVRDIFKKHNLYDAEKIASYLYTNKGRIDGLHKVYPLDVQEHVKRIESLFPSSFSINKKKYLMFMQMMGRYVDQAQSTNIFFDKPNDVYLSRLSFLDWINGSKTEYYLRRLAGTDKIDPFMDTEKNVCKRDEGCMWCE